MPCFVQGAPSWRTRRPGFGFRAGVLFRVGGMLGEGGSGSRVRVWGGFGGRVPGYSFGFIVVKGLG